LPNAQLLLFLIATSLVFLFHFPCLRFGFFFFFFPWPVFFFIAKVFWCLGCSFLLLFSPFSSLEFGRCGAYLVPGQDPPGGLSLTQRNSFFFPFLTSLPFDPPPSRCALKNPPPCPLLFLTKRTFIPLFTSIASFSCSLPPSQCWSKAGRGLHWECLLPMFSTHRLCSPSILGLQ